VPTVIEPDRLDAIEKQNFAFGMTIAEKNELVRAYRQLHFTPKETEACPPPDQL
jgi:hypothetical protein